MLGLLIIGYWENFHYPNKNISVKKGQASSYKKEGLAIKRSEIKKGPSSIEVAEVISTKTFCFKMQLRFNIFLLAVCVTWPLRIVNVEFNPSYLIKFNRVSFYKPIFNFSYLCGD